MCERVIMGLLLLIGLTIPGFSWNILSQGPIVLTLNIVVLLGLIGFIVFLKIREKGDE